MHSSRVEVATGVREDPIWQRMQQTSLGHLRYCRLLAFSAPLIWPAPADSPAGDGTGYVSK